VSLFCDAVGGWKTGFARVTLAVTASVASCQAQSDSQLPAAATATFRLTGVDIRLAAAAVTSFTGRRVSLFSEVQGRVDLITAESVDAAQATQLLGQIARNKGWQVLISASGDMTVRPQRFAMTELQPVQRMYQLGSLRAIELAPRVRPLLSVQGRMGAPDDHRLFVSDIPTAQAQVEELLRSAEESQSPSPTPASQY